MAMREADKLAYRKRRPGPDYRFCPACRARVTMPCVACATRKYVQSQQLLRAAAAEASAK